MSIMCSKGGPAVHDVHGSGQDRRHDDQADLVIVTQLGETYQNGPTDEKILIPFTSQLPPLPWSRRSRPGRDRLHQRERQGRNPAGCGSAETWRPRDDNIKGKVMRQELRDSYACGVVRWSRLIQIGGSGPTLHLIQSAWSPNGASQGGAGGRNYTYTVNAPTGAEVCRGVQAYWVDSFGRLNYIGWFFAGCYRG